ncbi:sugar phosphate isomerase/epimerase family protein [Epibacterium ulvae]|uniref:sugar phosphate isomerase/epimerase family protein n=1 Tax=Epibacterium ulvae TaxID=1156985 RepID=UPI0024919FC8|nr:sugar phosphate isomerase/epimerase family protein [Epibacterium ulvae]
MNTATTRNSISLGDAAELANSIGFRCISPAFTEIETYGLKASRRLFSSNNLKVIELNPSKIFNLGSKSLDRRYLENLKRSIELAAEIGALKVIVIAGGVTKAPTLYNDLFARLVDVLAACEVDCTVSGVQLCLEPLHPVFASDRSFICDVSEALKASIESGPHVGITIDTYHTWWDADLFKKIANSPKNKIRSFHINDWCRRSGDRLKDREMVGDGIIDLPSYFNTLKNIDFLDSIEIEIMSSKQMTFAEVNSFVQTARNRTLATISV